jgi:hypothetical protein
VAREEGDGSSGAVAVLLVRCAYCALT